MSFTGKFSVYTCIRREDTRNKHVNNNSVEQFYPMLAESEPKLRSFGIIMHIQIHGEGILYLKTFFLSVRNPVKGCQLIRRCFKCVRIVFQSAFRRTGKRLFSNFFLCVQ